MVRAVLADLHLGTAAADLERFLCATAEVERRGAREVVLLGDVFRALVAFPQFWDQGVRQGLQELRRLRGRGVRVVLVEGNREFFLDSPALAPYCDAAGRCHSFSAGGRRFFLEHGDLVNVADWKYLLWRGISKSRAARLWARLLPGGLARPIVYGTEERLAATNFTHRRHLPEKRLRAVAQAHFAAGVHVVLWGHFHRPWWHAEGERVAAVVPAFAEFAAVVWVEEDTGRTAVGQLEGAHFVDTPLQSWYQRGDGPGSARNGNGSHDSSCG